MQEKTPLMELKHLPQNLLTAKKHASITKTNGGINNFYNILLRPQDLDKQKTTLFMVICKLE